MKTAALLDQGCVTELVPNQTQGRLFFSFHHSLDWKQVTERREQQQVGNRK